MNRTLSLLICLFALALPLSAAAQTSWELNRFTLTPLGDGLAIYDNCTWQPQNSLVTIGIYLWFAVNEDYDNGQVHQVQSVGGFECKLRPEGTASGSAVILAKRFPVPAIDVGQYESMIVGFGEPLLVQGEVPTLLAEVDIFFGEPEAGKAAAGIAPASPVGCYYEATAFLWLEPATPASISGRLAYLDAGDPDNDPLVPADAMDFYDLPSLIMVPIIVGTEDKSWDGVKALYR